LNPLTWLMIGLIAYALWSTQRSVRRTSSARERSLAIRGALFFWVLTFLFILALVFLPNRGRVLMMIPAFLITAWGMKAYRNSRERLRSETQDQGNIERMKRVN
jgi:hypothetical protein